MLPWHFERGRAAYRRGEPMPPRPADDDDCTDDAGQFWLGYMFSRALKLYAETQERERIEEWARGERDSPYR